MLIALLILIHRRRKRAIKPNSQSNANVEPAHELAADQQPSELAGHHIYSELEGGLKNINELPGSATTSELPGDLVHRESQEFDIHPNTN